MKACRADRGVISRRACYTNDGCRSDACVEANAAYMRNYVRSAAGKEANRRGHTIIRYGITVAEYEAMLAAQGGVCAICLKECSTGERLSIDHDHDTNQVRALLCRRCNAGLGSFDDDPSVLANALQYLLKYKLDTIGVAV